MNRVCTLNSFKNAYNNVNNSYYKTVKINNLIGADNKFSSFNDLYKSSDVKLVVDIAKANEEADSYIQSINLVRLKLTTTHNIVDSILNIAEDARNQFLMYQSFKSRGIENQIQDMAESYLNNVKSVLNSQLSGYYILSGSKIDTPPVDNIIDPILQDNNYKYYRGDDFVFSAKLNENMEIKYSINANESAFGMLITGLNLIYHNFDNANKINEAENLFEKAINEILVIRSHLMNDYAILDNYENYWQNIKYNSNEHYNNLEVDYNFSLPDLFSDLAAAEAILDASQAMFAKITSTNMIEHL